VRKREDQEQRYALLESVKMKGNSQRWWAWKQWQRQLQSSMLGVICRNRLHLPSQIIVISRKEKKNPISSSLFGRFSVGDDFSFLQTASRQGDTHDPLFLTFQKFRTPLCHMERSDYKRNLSLPRHSIIFGVCALHCSLVQQCQQWG